MKSLVVSESSLATIVPVLVSEARRLLAPLWLMSWSIADLAESRFLMAVSSCSMSW
jgi:hypothetical protein